MPLPLLNLFTALGPSPDTNHVIKCQGLYHYEVCSFSTPLSPSSSLVCSSVFPCSPLGPRKLTSFSSRVWAGLGQWDVAARNERARRETVGDTSPSPSLRPCLQAVPAFSWWHQLQWAGLHASFLTWLQETISSPLATAGLIASHDCYFCNLNIPFSSLEPIQTSKIVSSLKFLNHLSWTLFPIWQWPYWYEAVT